MLFAGQLGAPLSVVITPGPGREEKLLSGLLQVLKQRERELWQ